MVFNSSEMFLKILISIFLTIKVFNKMFYLIIELYIAGVLKPRSPVYTITSYSEMKKRPSKSSKIYTALRGPSANDALLLVRQNNIGEQIKTSENEWFNNEPLFLYAGRRYCVEKDLKSRSLISLLFRRSRSENVSLFTEKNKIMHPELLDTNLCLEEQLMDICGTLGKGIQIVKLENEN